MESINQNDIRLINSLSARDYSGNTLLSNASAEERNHLSVVKNKLKKIIEFFSERYAADYGPFDTSVSSGNPIAIGGRNFKRVWSGMFKGASNKQYAAQISIVINPKEACLDVGFYFGRASGHSLNNNQRTILERQLKKLGSSLSDTINADKSFRAKYDKLFDFGFKAYKDGHEVLGDDWFNLIKNEAKNSQIIAKVYPNDFNVIESSTIDSFISQIIFLMGGINTSQVSGASVIKPLTPEQRAKEAERLAQIGLKGELFVMESEKFKLNSLKAKRTDYPKHVALESMTYGYDILSLDADENEVYIEVKTTTRSQDDKASRKFFISSNEFSFYENNKRNYKLLRVYDIDNSPIIEEIDLNSIKKKADGYICSY